MTGIHGERLVNQHRWSMKLRFSCEIGEKKGEVINVISEYLLKISSTFLL